MKLSVIIVPYNCPIVLKNCLDSIKKYDGLNLDVEIIISDNSTNDEVEKLIKDSYQWVKYIKNNNNGFGAGNNRGVEVSSGEYLLFLNPDTLLVEPVFDFAIRQFESDRNLAMFGVKLIDVEGRNNHSIGLLEKRGNFRNFIGWRFLVPLNIFLSREMYIIGADIFVRKDIFLEVGSFDENIFMYNEESDLTRRILKKFPNYAIRFFPQKKIVHLEGGTQTSKKLSEDYLKKLAVSYVYFCGKHGLNPLDSWEKRKSKLMLKLVFFKLIHNKSGVLNTESDIYNAKKMIKEIEDACR